MLLSSHSNPTSSSHVSAVIQASPSPSPSSCQALYCHFARVPSILPRTLHAGIITAIHRGPNKSETAILQENCGQCSTSESNTNRGSCLCWASPGLPFAPAALGRPSLPPRKSVYKQPAWSGSQGLAPKTDSQGSLRLSPHSPLLASSPSCFPVYVHIYMLP